MVRSQHRNMWQKLYTSWQTRRRKGKKKREEGPGTIYSSQSTPPVTYFLQLGPTSLHSSESPKVALPAEDQGFNT
jgi:hypothetical protein